jgi:hypothetical protein
MGGKFFITGLPRSRTAWFSAFMTASGFPCLHEGINNCRTLEEYKYKVSEISDSNTGLCFLNHIDDRPLLVIHRKDYHDGAFENVSLHQLNGLHVNFNEIDDRISEIFTYLTGDHINKNIYDLFKGLNITTMIEMNQNAAKELLNEADK